VKHGATKSAPKWRISAVFAIVLTILPQEFWCPEEDFAASVFDDRYPFGQIIAWNQ
jgi:hypothetical protein